MDKKIFIDLSASLFDFPRKAVIASLYWRKTAQPLTTDELRRRRYFIRIRIAEPEEALDVELFDIDGKPRRRNVDSSTFALPDGASPWHRFTKKEILDFVTSVQDENPIHRTENPVVPGCLEMYLLHAGPCEGASSMRLRFYKPCYHGELVYLAPGDRENTLIGTTDDRILFTVSYA